MRKIDLDMNIPHSKQQIHDYLRDKLELPEYYGSNLDALYDCLSTIGEPTAVGVTYQYPSYESEDHDLISYIEKVKMVFRDAEDENPNLAVFWFSIYD